MIVAWASVLTPDSPGTGRTNGSSGGAISPLGSARKIEEGV